MNMQGGSRRVQRPGGGVWEERSCGWPGPSLNRRGARSLGPGPGPHSGAGKDSLSSPGRGWGWGVSPPWASPRARSWGARRLKEQGPWPSSLQSSWQEGESRRCPRALGSGRGVGRSPPALPLLKLRALSPPMIRTGRAGGSAFRPRDSGRWPRATPLRPLSSRGGRGEAGARLSVRLWGSQLRPLGPGLRRPGSGGSAPSCACAGAVRYANGAGSPRGPATPRRARRAVLREWARATPPAGARASEPRRAAAGLGRPAFGRRPVGRARSRGRQFPRSSPLFPHRDGAAGPRAAATSPRPVSEENFRPQPRWPSGPALGD